MRSIGFNSITIGLPSLILDLAGDLASYGLVLGLYTMVITIFQTPYAFLSDRIGRRKVLIITMGLFIFGTALAGFAQTLTQLILFRIVQGLGAFSAVNYAILSDVFQGRARYKAITYNTMSFTLGYILGMAVGGLLEGIIGGRGLFFFSAGISGISYIMVILFLPETAGAHGTQAKFPLQEDISHEESRGFSLAKLKGKIKPLMNRTFIGGIIITSIRASLMSGFLALVIWVFSVNYKIPSKEVSLYFLPIVIVYIISLFSSSKLVKKYSQLKIILLGFVQITLAHALMAFSEDFWYYWGVMMFAIVGFALSEPAISTTVSDSIPNEVRGLGSGIYQTAMFFGEAVGQIFIPRWGESLGISNTYLMTLMFLAAAIGLTLYLMRAESHKHVH